VASPLREARPNLFRQRTNPTKATPRTATGTTTPMAILAPKDRPFSTLLPFDECLWVELEADDMCEEVMVERSLL
jgi:hypothetical protein